MELPLPLREQKCSYCPGHLRSLATEWDDEHHYISALCSACGKKNWVKINYASSGHIPQESSPSLESMVRKVKEG